MLNISVGNPVWMAVTAVTVIATVLLYVLLHKKTTEQKNRIMLVIGYVIMVLFFIQRFFMFRFELYIELYGSSWKQILIDLLPLQLCYLSTVLLIIGLHLKSQYLLAFCFYISPLGAILALVSSVAVFNDVSLLEPSVMLFYLLHVLLVAVYWNVGFLGLFKIGIKNGVMSVMILCVAYGFVHIVNFAGQCAGIDAMNYMFTFSPEGSSMLEMFWNLIPVPCVYLVVPGVPIIALWVLLLTLIYRCVLGRTKRFEKT